MDSILSYKKDATADYYHVLACSENASLEQILAEFKVRVLEVHPDKNPGDPSAEERFKTLQLAKMTLADPEMRKKYDTWRTSGISMPFEQWISLSKNVHTSLHWAARKNDVMLEGPETCSTVTNAEDVSIRGPRRFINTWRQETGNHILQRFRNYDI